MSEDATFDAWCASGTGETLEEYEARAVSVALPVAAPNHFVGGRIVHTPRIAVDRSRRIYFGDGTLPLPEAIP